MSRPSTRAGKQSAACRVGRRSPSCGIIMKGEAQIESHDIHTSVHVMPRSEANFSSTAPSFVSSTVMHGQPSFDPEVALATRKGARISMCRVAHCIFVGLVAALVPLFQYFGNSTPPLCLEQHSSYTEDCTLQTPPDDDMDRSRGWYPMRPSTSPGGTQHVDGGRAHT